MVKNSWYMLMVFTVPCFADTSVAPATPAHEATVVELLQSTRIIRELMRTNHMGELLEAHDPEQLELLLNNFSPAQIAAEVEIDRAAMPVLVCFFNTKEQHDRLLPILMLLAQKYNNKVKVIMIDGEQLFQLTYLAEITAFPTFIFLNKEQEAVRTEEDMDLEALEAYVEQQLNNPTIEELICTSE